MDKSLEISLNGKILGNLPIVAQGWSLARDTANMFFIFIMLYIAIGTILQLQNVQWKRALANLIIVALLINFSLFFTKVIIDGSNILMVGFYNSIVTNVKINNVVNTYHGPSIAIMEGFELSSVVQPATNDVLDPMDIFLIYTGGTVLNMITFFFFLVGTILFIGRAVAFLFLMILSPFAFVAMILPSTTRWSSMWWEKLINMALVGPLFMFGLYFITIAIRGNNIKMLTGSSSASAGAAFSGEGANYAIFATFAVLIGLYLGTLQLTQQVGGGVARFAVKWGSKANRMFYGGMAAGVFAPTAYLRRKRAQSELNSAEMRQNLASNDAKIREQAERRAYKLKKISLDGDVRNSSVGQALIKSTGVSELGWGSSVSQKGVLGTTVGMNSQEQLKRKAEIDAIALDTAGKGTAYNPETGKYENAAEIRYTNLQKEAAEKRKKLAQAEKDMNDTTKTEDERAKAFKSAESMRSSVVSAEQQALKALGESMKAAEEVAKTMDVDGLRNAASDYEARAAAETDPSAKKYYQQVATMHRRQDRERVSVQLESMEAGDVQADITDYQERAERATVPAEKRHYESLAAMARKQDKDIAESRMNTMSDTDLTASVNKYQQDAQDARAHGKEAWARHLESQATAGRKIAKDRREAQADAKFQNAIASLSNTTTPISRTEAGRALNNLGGPDKVANLPADVITKPEVAYHVDAEMLAKIARKGNLNAAQRQALINQARTNPANSAAILDWLANTPEGRRFA
jgi:hypothetical protein